MRSTATTGLAVALNISFGAPGQIVGVWIYKSEEASKAIQQDIGRMPRF